ncbi:hypothetical protein ASPZODRAFT_145690 [Penicilliopsis zonata CBS 506.65]|uniref:Serine-rich protein n=1 Tax=Penicilliopsis zonata CBS 506.65 TaxID=1073090 RepID=A0A1L9S9B5_9EURO|nr:hypothetical protein ASPZODRAFT_145690 [Penicilliopsis zonata CBS 506.65]OJJ43745.1 hypothetical protein ASPZODRAFT_145690 [Penicilliopsis zonata CBS 506.65]
MSSSQRTSPSPPRRALHERTPSQSNMASAASPAQSLRLVNEPRGLDIYSATPFPTKPEHILLPRPGKGQEFVTDSSSYGVADSYDVSTVTFSETSQLVDDSLIERSFNDTWDSSTVDAVNTPSQVWEEDPSSSRSTFPDTEVLEKPFDREESEEVSDAAFSDDGMPPLPTVTPTIKAVVSEPGSPDLSSDETAGPATRASSNGSPNVVTIGPPSSPNFVALDSSSLNFVRIGNSSSNPSSTTRSNSLSSMNSLGTVVRHPGAAQWARSASSEQSSSRSQSFRSTPPHTRPLPVHPNAAFALNSRETSRTRSATDSSQGDLSTSDMQTIIDSGVPVQYPIIRAPSSSSSWVDTSNVESSSPVEYVPDESSGRWNPHLSTVPSQWSAEAESRSVSPAVDRSESRLSVPSRPSAALLSQNTSSSVWLVTDDEHLDSLSGLRSDVLSEKNPGLPTSLSSGSRRSTAPSIRRPGTSSSFIFNVIPAWAKYYYRSDGRPANPTLAMIDGRPSTARPSTANSSILGHIPTALSKARMQPRVVSDPRDPRSHWVPDPDAETDYRPDTSYSQLQQSWSPHLYPDRQQAQYRGSLWGAPSLDSRTEPMFGRRNVQVYSFCFGFIFPLAWLIAAFLPLPHRAKSIEDSLSSPEIETALRMRVFDIDEKRYANARWWRNLNRWMTPLGVAIIIIIITLAVVGTRSGL